MQIIKSKTQEDNFESNNNIESGVYMQKYEDDIPIIINSKKEDKNVEKIRQNNIEEKTDDLKEGKCKCTNCMIY